MGHAILMVIRREWFNFVTTAAGLACIVAIVLLPTSYGWPLVGAFSVIHVACIAVYAARGAR